MRKIKTLEKNLESETGVIRLKMCLGEEDGESCPKTYNIFSETEKYFSSVSLNCKRDFAIRILNLLFSENVTPITLEDVVCDLEKQSFYQKD